MFVFQFKYYFRYFQVDFEAQAQPGGATTATAELPVKQLFQLNKKISLLRTPVDILGSLLFVQVAKIQGRFRVCCVFLVDVPLLNLLTQISQISRGLYTLFSHNGYKEVDPMPPKYEHWYSKAIFHMDLNHCAIFFSE